MKKIKLTEKEIQKMNLQIKQYFKKEDFIINNLKNEKYFFYVYETYQFFLIIYKKVKNENFKTFELRKGFYTPLKEYHIEEKKYLILKDYIENQNKKSKK